MVSLVKGQKVSLTKDFPTLKNVYVGTGWDPARGLTGSFDCDSGVLMLRGGKLSSNDDIVSFRNLMHGSKSVKHHGDNLTGQGDGDDEVITIKLDKVPAEYDKLVIFVNIFQASSRHQHFGMIESSFVRLVNEDTKEELCRYEIQKDYNGMTAMLFAEIYRHNGEWKFNALGLGTEDGSIDELARRYM